ncbi:hypothetical protein NHF48_019825 [Sphingomonas sp. H160509]|uniref:hypothetical protein n=1 Tax=Sphingomonas sp. H160509 TaxID=2955313 RepID=UPI002096A5C5|nr:hypothetical protein [Sphingomonas sp. H160509]MDD1452668.1 hypothetical protein [Sphingomonas sp. H160509]
MNAALKPYFSGTIALLKGSNNPAAILEAFNAAMVEHFGEALAPVPAPRRKRHVTPEVPAACIMSAVDMRTIMHDFWEIYGTKMTAKEREWFAILTGVVNKGTKLAGKQISTVNSISERIADMAIIM